MCLGQRFTSAGSQTAKPTYPEAETSLNFQAKPYPILKLILVFHFRLYYKHFDASQPAQQSGVSLSDRSEEGKDQVSTSGNGPVLSVGIHSRNTPSEILEADIQIDQQTAPPCLLSRE